MCVCLCVHVCLQERQWTDREPTECSSHSTDRCLQGPPPTEASGGSGSEAPLCLLLQPLYARSGAKLCEHRLPRDHERERLGDRPFVKSMPCLLELISAKPWLFQTWDYHLRAWNHSASSF